MYRITLTIVLLITISTPSAYAEFEFQKGDRVSIIGNALADRMQHDGWMETLLQSTQPDKQLAFRNMAFSGDQASESARPRNKDFTTPADYLKHTQADVIFVFFGYNESFAGEMGLPHFRDHTLIKMIADYRALQPNGHSAPRFVLFSPIAHENLKNPNLPDGSENNKRLALYTQAIKQVAKETNCTFVDLFTPSQKLFANAKSPLTINGVHLNTEGNRQIAQVIVESITGQKTPASNKLESLRQAVLDKNWHWFNRYRATSGNDIWGTRSTLAFTDDQTNAEVLQHELLQLDIMTANRDQQIWARANHSDLTLDDSNVPPPVKVISNVGGGSDSSSAEKEGSLDYISGEEGLKYLTLKDGFEANLFADEERFPELVNPVQMQVDAKGRMWVAAWKDYPKWKPGREVSDSILILPDDDNDGVADRCITFAKVHDPIGFEFWNGGVIVSSQPEIIFLKDTDGDDVADVRIVLLQGLGSADTHCAANNLVMGPDGAIYFTTGVFLAHNIETPWGPSLNTKSMGVFRFAPRRFTTNFHANIRPNAHGVSFDYWGYQYATDGTSGNAFQIVPTPDGFQAKKLLEKQVRPVPASEIISSSQFPKEMQGNFMICNSIGFLGIKEYSLERNVETGTVWGEPVGDLLVSSDKNFRPTDAIFGDDGALYVSDWHNLIIGHMQHNLRDPNRDHKHGRIYRVTAKNRPLQEPVKIHNASITQLLDNLKHPVDSIRHRSRVQLNALDSSVVIAATQKWLKQFDPNNKADAHHLLEALWVHQQHNVKNPILLNQLLASSEPHARIAAKTVQHHWYNIDATTNPPPKAAVAHKAVKSKLPAVDNTDPRVTVVRINTLVEKMKFDIKEFKVKAGHPLKIIFSNPDFMPHNLLVVEPGASEEVGLAALALGAKGFEMQFRPVSDKILAGTKMLDNGETQTISMTAPTKPGLYEFVCTFPGHYMLMRGIMRVGQGE